MTLCTAVFVLLVVTACHCRVAPKIQDVLVSSDMVAGGKATATCVLKTGTQPLSFVWLRNGKDASSERNVKVKSTEDYSVLVINPTDASSAGNYTCIVKNLAGTDSKTVQIEVQASPMLEKIPTDTEVGIGATKTWQCSALGSPKPKISWKKQVGRQRWIPLNDHARIVIDGESITLSDIEATDAGTYSCEATNGVGEPAVATFRLIVHGNTVIPQKTASRILP